MGLAAQGTGRGRGRASFDQGEEGGRGFWTQNLVYQKWPDQIVPFVNFVFSRDDHFGLGRGGRGFWGEGSPPPPLVFNYSKEAVGRGGAMQHRLRPDSAAVAGARIWATDPWPPTDTQSPRSPHHRRHNFRTPSPRDLSCAEEVCHRMRSPSQQKVKCTLSQPQVAGLCNTVQFFPEENLSDEGRGGGVRGSAGAGQGPQVIPPPLGSVSHGL